MKFLKYVILFILLLFRIWDGYAQNLELRGIVLDIEKQPMEFVNLILLSTTDSVYIDGTITDSIGKFQFSHLTHAEYLIKASFVGYKNTYKKININKTYLDTIYLDMSDIGLKEIVVSGNKPLIEKGEEGILINVGTTLLNGAGTAIDVIGKIPGIVVTDNNISVFGKGTPIIYIDNRKINDQQELDRLQSIDISQIELLTNPGSKYDAEGRSVLLIKLKNKSEGFSFKLTERFMIGKYWSNFDNINFTYNKNNLNLFASYYPSQMKTKVTENTYHQIKRSINDIGDYKYNNFIYNRKSNQISLGFDYNINDNNTIGGQYQGEFSKSNLKSAAYNYTYYNQILNDESTLFSNKKENSKRNLLNLFYNGVLNKSTDYQINIDYLRNVSTKDENTQKNSIVENRDIMITSEAKHNLFAGRINFNYNTNIGEIVWGGDFTQIDGDGFIYNKEGYVKSNIYTNKEKRFAIYTGYLRKISNFKLKAGLRYEYSKLKSTDDSLKAIIVEDINKDIYPNISLGGKIDQVQLDLFMSKRTMRPSFNQLNGIVAYISKLIFQKGNPYLKKTNIYDLNIQAIYKDFFISIGYSYERNPIAYYGYIDTDFNNIIMSYFNLPKYQEINSTINFDKEVSFWNPNYSISIKKPFMSTYFNNLKKHHNEIETFINLSNDFICPKGFILSLNFLYQSNYKNYILESKGYKKVNMGIRKNFLNNSLKINFLTYDIFNWWEKRKNSLNVNNINFQANNRKESRYLVFTINYLLHNSKKNYRGKSSIKEDVTRF